MSAFVRYPLLGCLALFLSACSSSGSQTLLGATEASTDATTGGYPDVEYLLADSAAITAAREKFVVNDPLEDTDAMAPSENVVLLNSRRSRIVNSAGRYLSTGALVAETDDSQDPATVSHETGSATCADSMAPTEANCVFDEDAFRDRVTFHLGRTNPNDAVNDVGFIGFTADRQPVMDYRGVRMSQVRFEGTDEKENTDPMEDPVESDYEYVGYDGMLQYSMFFVGVYKFFDDGMNGDDPELKHLRFENASLGQIFDADPDNAGIDNPTVSLTGDGVMVGMESENDTLDSHLVQGDVNIDYNPANTDNELDITITNIQRLVGDADAWYKDTADLTWMDVGVTGSKFDETTSNTKKLLGSFYGTGDDYEVGGTFYHGGSTYSIVGAFGATVSEEP